MDDIDMRYILQKSSTPKHWVCTDQDNGLICVFEEHKFNETQKFTFLENMGNQDVTKLARIVNEMAAWLSENHYKKAMP